MDAETKAANMARAMHMASRLDGLYPLLVLGYGPEDGQWRVLIDPAIMPTLQDARKREAFLANLRTLITHSSHPENVTLLGPDDPDPVPGDPAELERMMESEEGGEG